MATDKNTAAGQPEETPAAPPPAVKPAPEGPYWWAVLGWLGVIAAAVALIRRRRARHERRILGRRVAIP